MLMKKGFFFRQELTKIIKKELKFEGKM